MCIRSAEIASSRSPPRRRGRQRQTELANKAREEYKFRQVGLAASIAVIGLLMVAIYLKLRQLEKQTSDRA